MMFVFFSCVNPKGKFGDCCYGGPDLESCFETLNDLVAKGWQLVSARLVGSPGSSELELPVEAFDGQPMTADLARLQRAWEDVLEQPQHFLQPNKWEKFRQQALSIMHRTMESQERAKQKREERNRRIEHLFKKADSIQSRIENTKAKWGVA